MLRGWQTDEERACQAAMAEQESLQQTQEREIAEAEVKAALVLDAKMLIEKDRCDFDHVAALGDPLPPTYGPTGQALQAQQLAPRDSTQSRPRLGSPRHATAAAAAPHGPTCRTRWCEDEGPPPQGKERPQDSYVNPLPRRLPGRQIRIFRRGLAKL